MSQLNLSHYAAVTALRAAYDRCQTEQDRWGCRAAINLLSYALKAADPSFSQAQFVADCGWLGSYHWDMPI